MLVRNPDHILQLSDAPELSQRAVYADVGCHPHVGEAQANIREDLRLQVHDEAHDD